MTATPPNLPGLADEAPAPALRAVVAADFARIQRRRRLAVLALGAAVAALLGLLALRHPGHPGGRAGGLAGLMIGLQALSGLVVVSAAFGWPSLGTRALRRHLAAVGLFGLALMVPLIEANDPTAGHPGWTCLLTGAAMALVLALGVALAAGRLLRRHAPAGLMLGLGCGALAWGPLHLMCRHHGAGHLMLGHGLIPALVVALLWASGRVWRRWAAG